MHLRIRLLELQTRASIPCQSPSASASHPAFRSSSSCSPSCRDAAPAAAALRPTPPTQPALVVVTNTLTPGTVGIAYSVTLLASGGTSSGYSWSVSSGALPAGLSLSTAGVISGTPSAAGSFPFTAKVTDSSAVTASASLSMTVAAATPLTSYEFTGDTSPVHDPAIIRQGSTYYVFVTDAGQAGGFIPIRCSQDKIAWTACGNVFTTLPSWVAGAVPLATDLWAPDISYFNGTYHLYYAASSFGSQVSGIGLATNTTLDSTDPNYKWVDQGAILTSIAGSDFNAIDPTILVDTTGSVWLTYGSFWNGIFQQQIDPTTGQIMAGSAINHLAERASTVQSDPIEGSSLVYKNGYYYLFASFDFCCETNPAQSDYKIAVGRGTSPNGPFLDQNGVDMVAGGGTILLTGDGVNWAGPGGETAYIDPTGGDLIVYHALNLNQNGLDYLFVRSLDFSTGWPVIGDTSVTTPYAKPTTTAVVASSATVTLGNPLTLTATVTGTSGTTPTGSVAFFAGTTQIGTAALSGTGASATAALSLSSLTVGTYSIAASYAGDSSNGGSNSPPISVTVQGAATPSTVTALTSSATGSQQGQLLSVYATVTNSSSSATPTGSVTFTDGATTLGTAPLDITGRATYNTVLLSPGAHSISASYAGNASFLASASASPVALTITKAPGTTTYTNPITITDPALGAVTSCPDPAIIKSQTGGVDTWYLYCTGDPHNASDVAAGGGLNNGHLISIYSSPDLINWTFVHDALPSLPSWAGPGALAWAPAIKFFNDQYYLYYIITTSTYAGGTSAIGVGTSATAAGPFTDSGTAAVEPELVAAGLDGSGPGDYRWVFDPDEIQDASGQRYLLFGSFLGGISVRKLSSDGLTTDPSSEVQIADDQRYEGGAWIFNGGYYYLLASSANCCAGPLTGYGVFAGRSTTPLGPYTDAAGVSLTATGVGGTPVLAMNGNTLVGPGGGSPFTDESGQDYYVYHVVSLTNPYYAGNNGYTQRPAAIDPLDWVNGWPVVRGGFGPSDLQSPQPAPAAQPSAINAYTLTANVNDDVNTAIPGLSDSFTESTLPSQWTSIHSMPAYTLTGSGLKMPTVGFDTTNAMASIPILSESAPAGDYMVEVKLSMDTPISTNGYDFTQAGLLIYGDDADYLRVDLVANSDTRQIEYIKGETPPAVNYPTWSATSLGPTTVVSGAQTAFFRLAKRTVDGTDWYTGYSSTDGTTWVRCGTWKHALGTSPSIGLYAGNRAGFNATFDYIHVSTLK